MQYANEQHHLNLGFLGNIDADIFIILATLLNGFSFIWL